MQLEAWRQRQQKQQSTRAYKNSARGEWITFDGEGWDRDEQGRQYYRFIVAANADGFQTYTVPSASHALTTLEALRFMTAVPHMYRKWCENRDKEYVQPTFGGFALGYDYAHILQDITQEQLQHLLTHGSYESDPTHIVEGLSARLTAGNLRIYGHDNAELISVWDTFKFYQAAFLKVMRAYASDDEWALIEAGKNRRSDDDHNMQTEMRYCLAECRVHSRAMNELQNAIAAEKLYISGWYGPGSLAAAAYRKHKTKEQYWKADSEESSEFQHAVRSAYVGGRFETTGHGWLPRMYGHDIRSAYPSGMRSLPCLKHGTWHHVKGEHAMGVMHTGLAVGLVEWHAENPPGGWGPYPMRLGQKRMDADLPIWPFDGRAWVWSEEFRAGLFLTDTVKVKEAWVYHERCQCTCFDWIQHYYDLRKRYKDEGYATPEKIIKLMINSLYGKLAQSVGKPPMPSWTWSGLITQSARAKLLRAIEINPEACMMVATDAVYSTTALDLDFGTALGQWDGPDEFGRTLVIQAGFWKDYDGHFDEKKNAWVWPAKTRGIAQKYVEPCWPTFEELWRRICVGTGSADDLVALRYSDHIGLQRARAQGISKLGVWVDDAVQHVRFRADKRPLLIGSPSADGWWKSAPKRRDQIGVGLAYEGSSSFEFFVSEQPDAAEWGYSDDG